MFQALFSQENAFVNYGSQHYYSVASYVLLCVLSIVIANRYFSERYKIGLGFAISLIPLLSVLIRMYCTYYEGEFLLEEDLPFFVCRLITFFLPFTMLFRHQFSFGILYFWILAGTMNAIITPDVEFGYPHYTAWFYWSIHAGLVVTLLYAVFVYKMRPYIRDFVNAIIAGFVYLVAVHAINIGLDANYAYTMSKPTVASLFDYMGPWPVYLITIQGIAFLLFVIVYVPYFVKDMRTPKR